jgi:hypothetical protein
MTSKGKHNCRNLAEKLAVKDKWQKRRHSKQERYYLLSRGTENGTES